MSTDNDASDAGTVLMMLREQTAIDAALRKPTATTYWVMIAGGDTEQVTVEHVDGRTAGDTAREVLRAAGIDPVRHKYARAHRANDGTVHVCGNDASTMAELRKAQVMN